MTEQLPPDLIEYEHELTDAIGRMIDGRRARRRRTVVPVAACAAAAVVAGGVGVGASLTSGGGLSPQAADAAVLRGAVAAIDQPAGSILHVKAVDDDQSASGPAVTDTREFWILPVPAGTPCNARQDCPAQDLRMSYQAGGSSIVVDSSTGPDDRTDLYDSDSDTVYEPPSVAASWQAPEPLDGQNLSALDPFSTQFGSELQQAINAGRARVVGDATVDSQSVVQIAGETVVCNANPAELPPSLGSRPPQNGQTCEELAGWTYDVTPGSYRPVQLQSSAAGGVSDTIVFETWETLPAAQNMDVFSLTAQHPGAQVDTSAADYRAESDRFDGVEQVPEGITATALPGARPDDRHRVR